MNSEKIQKINIEWNKLNSNEQLYFYSFDDVKEFKHYFQHNNITEVLKDLKKAGKRITIKNY